MEQNVLNLQNLEVWADEKIKSLQPPFVLLLEGDIGVGKTTVTQMLLKRMGVSDVDSPTYALHREHCGRFKIHHFDLYRISSLYELDDMGFWEFFDGESLIIIEWPEIIGNYSFIPEPYCIEKVHIEILQNTEHFRKFTFTRLR